jgi:hypothetical protein
MIPNPSPLPPTLEDALLYMATIVAVIIVMGIILLPRRK